MAGNVRQFAWHQGDLITSDAAKALELLTTENINDQHFAVVVSHDCDLSAAQDKEPFVEVLTGKRIEKLGADSFGKTARRLHIEYQSEKEMIAIELLAATKKPIPKRDLFATKPRNDLRLDSQGIVILQRWLSSRYDRAAFPESFEDRLRKAKTSGKRTFLKQIEEVLADGGDYIRAIFFELDDNKNIERTEAEDIYQLGITVLYNSLKNEPTALEAATKAAEELERLFHTAFYLENAGWREISLIYCDPISDSVVTLAQREQWKQWRLEHMSLQEDPPQPMVSR
jgi:hypothetical protein